ALLRSETDASRQLTLARKHPRAAATAPPELSGLAEDAHSAIRGEFLATVAPEAVAQRTDLVAALGAAETAMQFLHGRTGEFIDFSQAASLEAQGYQGAE